MEKKYYGPIKATIDDQAGTVVLTCKRGNPRYNLSPGNMANIAAWAVDSLINQGYEVDISDIEKFFTSGNCDLSAKSQGSDTC